MSNVVDLGAARKRLRGTPRRCPLRYVPVLGTLPVVLTALAMGCQL